MREDGDTSKSKSEHHPRSQLSLFMENAATGDTGKVGLRKAVERMATQVRARASIALVHSLLRRMRLLATWTR